MCATPPAAVQAQPESADVIDLLIPPIASSRCHLQGGEYNGDEMFMPDMVTGEEKEKSGKALLVPAIF
jgi:hypothetical protein